jgi:hypothetical protein
MVHVRQIALWLLLFFQCKWRCVLLWQENKIVKGRCLIASLKWPEMRKAMIIVFIRMQCPCYQVQLLAKGSASKFSSWKRGGTKRTGVVSRRFHCNQHGHKDTHVTKVYAFLRFEKQMLKINVPNVVISSSMAISVELHTKSLIIIK